MLLYTSAHYITFSTILILSLFYILRLFYLSSIYRLNIVPYLHKVFISWVLYLTLLIFTALKVSLNTYSGYILLTHSFEGKISYIGLTTLSNLNKVSSFSGNYYSVYCYPFIYVFILVTVLSIIFCMSYNTDELLSFMLFCKVILLAGYILFFTDSLILFFFAYEMLLIPSFFILYKFAKTRRCVEAAYLMFFWTQFGALFLIFSFIYIFVVCDTSKFSIIYMSYFSQFEVDFIFICCLLGFGVKFPIWPFYGWLPKAHVEASTNFSIFLSGVLVKFAFFGFFKCLSVLNFDPTAYLTIPFLLQGIVDSVMKLFCQVDLKKLVAYSTVLEMHWLTLCVVTGNGHLLCANFCMLISHALLSTNSFLLVDAITRRFKTRLITELNGLNFLTPKLFLFSLVNCLIFLGFPGSLFFIAEVLFFAFSFDLFPLYSLVLLTILFLIAPTFLVKPWLNLMFSKSKFLSYRLPSDLSLRELYLFMVLPELMFWLGFTWQAFVI